MMPLLGVIMVYGRPVVNYVKAKLRGYDLAVVLGKNGRLKVIPSLYRKLEVSGNDAWLPKNPAFFNWDGVQTCVVYDGWGIILDPRMLLAARTEAWPLHRQPTRRTCRPSLSGSIHSPSQPSQPLTPSARPCSDWCQIGRLNLRPLLISKSRVRTNSSRERRRRATLRP